MESEASRVVSEETCFPCRTKFTTGNLGWPNSDIPVYSLKDEFYLPLDAVIIEFDLKEHVSKNGYKFIDKLLEEQLPGERISCRKQTCLTVFFSFVITFVLNTDITAKN